MKSTIHVLGLSLHIWGKRIFRTTSYNVRFVKLYKLLAYGKAVITFSLLTIFFGKRGLAVIALSSWLREIDDVVDGDSQLPKGTTLLQYLIDKKTTVERIFRNTWKVDNEETDFLFWFACVYSGDSYFVHKQACQALDLFHMELNCREKKFLSITDLLPIAQGWETIVFESFCKIVGGNFLTYKEKVGNRFGLFQEIDWFLDLEEDSRKGIVYITTDDISRIGLNFGKILEWSSRGQLAQNTGYCKWRESKRRFYIVQLEKLINTVRENPFDNTFANILFFRLVIPRFKIRLEES